MLTTHVKNNHLNVCGHLFSTQSKRLLLLLLLLLLERKKGHVAFAPAAVAALD